ncbi:MAG: general secretion pathway protein GspK [Candidatus Omnitrophica bacterium]|nr:general secretion pathway protein GspK [Candidatus Omnitrophota bacterium]MBI2496258.1 general secretion pathway protein GspK [Candidatus Omnitrophota bacterium]
MISSRTGSLLVITLWLVTIITVLVVAIARYLSLEVRLTRYRLAREQARTLARSGVYLAMQRLEQDEATSESDGKRYDWLGDEWASFPEGDPADPTVWIVPDQMRGTDPQASRWEIRIHMADEERKLNLNALPGPGDVFFRAASALLGSAQLAATVEDALDAEDPPAPSHSLGVESDSAATPPYQAKNGPIAAFEELLELPGMAAIPIEQVSAFRQLTSVYLPVLSKLNINTVTPELLVAVGFREATAQAIRSCRERGTVFADPTTLVPTAEACVGPNGLSTSDPDEQGLLMSLFGVESHTFTVVSEARMDRPALRVRMEAVIRRSPDGLQVLAWREG